jgi:di/tricarboxylate transporter
MIVEGTLRSRGLAPLDFFSWTPFGLAVLAAAIAFMLAARGLLSKQLAAKDAVASTPSVHDLVDS